MGGRFDQNALYIYEIFEQWKNLFGFMRHKKIYFKTIFCCIYIIYHLLKTRGKFYANKIDILLGTIQKHTN